MASEAAELPPPDYDKGPAALTFLSAWFCPFAQRTELALQEKKIPFNYYEVAIRNPRTGLWFQLDEKPAWFTRVNPLGKVPTLVYREDETLHSIYESLICNEFLEEYALQAPPLMPPHPAVRARARIVMDHFAQKFVPLFYRILVRQEKAEQDAAAAGLRTEMEWLEAQLDPAGPWFMGSDFSLVDCAVLPWFLRMPVLEHYRSLSVPKHLTRLKAWAAAAAQRPAVHATFRTPGASGVAAREYDAALLQHYQRYADATANSTSARDFR